MKLRILNFGVPATHSALVDLSFLLDTVCISDFDAFVYDPAAFSSQMLQQAGIDPRFPQPTNIRLGDDGSDRIRILNRHATEVSELLVKKQGVVIVLLRPNTPQVSISRPSGTETFSPYFLIERTTAGIQSIIRCLKPGKGSAIKAMSGTRVPGYLRILRTNLVFEAVVPVHETTTGAGTVYATNSVGDATAVEMPLESGGLVLFVPIPKDVPADRVGAAIVETVRQRLQVASPETIPNWVEGVTVPGAEEHSAEISQLEQQIGALQERLSALSSQRNEVLKHRELLYASGKLVLEPAVRRAFRHLGFQVREPEDYEGEWDLDMTNPEGLSFVGEIEGPEGAVDVDKLRQLLDYQQEQVLSGSNPKALLVGNAYRFDEPENRQPQFTEHVLNGAARYQIGLISTVELFKALCAVLANPDEHTKREIRQSISECVGVWKFAGPDPLLAAPAEPEEPLRS